MKRSAERFLTTHTGSLPRPPDLIRMMFAREEGVPVDASALAARVRGAVEDVVRMQVESGLDVVNDGEMSKPSYATYIKDRLHGFGGESHALVYQDLAEFPELARRVFGDPGRSRRRTPACTGPISVRDPRAAQADAEVVTAALARAKAGEGFLSAASPGVISLFFRNDHYASHEAYLAAIAEAMRDEYETVARAGLIVQIDCPDLAMEGPRLFQHEPLSRFLQIVETHVTAINEALVAVPPERVRLHVCWGNYDGPHTHDVPLEALLPILTQARVGALSIEFANPRHQHEYRALRKHRLPDGMLLLPGVIDSVTNFVEHPEVVADRIVQAVEAVGDRSRVIASVDCGFGTFAGSETVAESVIWAKLRALRDGAALASQRLWAGA